MTDVPPIRIRYRIRFAKLDLLRWIGHLDLARLWERVIRRASLRPSMTEGFHPKPRISFPTALALGIESDDEIVEIDLAEDVPPAEMLRRLVDDRQPGLVIHRVAKLPDGHPKARIEHTEYEILPPTDARGDDADRVDDAVAMLRDTDAVTLKRKKKEPTISLAEQLLSVSSDAGRLQFSLAAVDGTSLRPDELLVIGGLDDFAARGAAIRRTAVVLHNEFHSDDPDAVAIRPASSDAAPSPPPPHAPKAAGSSMEKQS